MKRKKIEESSNDPEDDEELPDVFKISSERKKKDLDLLTEVTRREQEEIHAKRERSNEPIVRAELKHRSGYRMRIEILVPEGSDPNRKISLGDMREAFEQLCLVAGQDDFAGALLQQVGSDVEVRLL
jgi:hypothetical protein